MKRLLLLVILFATTGVWAQSRVEQATIESKLLGTTKRFLVYLPNGYDTSGRDYPVLYLLHGAGDDETGWRDKGTMQLIADEMIESGRALPMVIVMPDASGTGEVLEGRPVNRGYFNIDGWPFEDHFFEEFIPHVESTWRIISDKKHRAVAGLSMGGGGSAGYAQAHPEMFGSACPLSGAVAGMGRGAAGGSPLLFVRNATPEQLEALRTVRWWVDCGDDDFLWEANVDFFAAMKKQQVPLQFRMRNGGHNWEYWQSGLQDVLTFISVGFGE